MSTVVSDDIPAPTRESLHTSISGQVMVDPDHHHPLAGQIIGQVTPGARDKWSYAAPGDFKWSEAPTVIHALDALLFEALTNYPTRSMVEWDRLMGVTA